jgi:uncharacterized membrane protein YfcA
MTLALPTLDLSLAVLLAVVFVAGIARGMSGFGSGMIVGPVAGAIYGPPAALAILVILDSLPAIPITIPAMRIARWREVLPVFFGLFLLFPLGIYILTHGDVTTLRWIIALTIFASVAVLMTGYRYRGPRTIATSLSVGGVSGLLSGIASIPGPPVIAYWLASDLPVAIVRANLLTFFLIGEIVSVGNIWAAGLFERGIVMVGVCGIPFYFTGLVIGGRCFGLASDRTYRVVTFALILLAAFLALPLFDGLFTGLAERLRGPG